jgi:hypothetical protein
MTDRAKPLHNEVMLRGKDGRPRRPANTYIRTLAFSPMSGVAPVTAAAAILM